MFKAKCKADRDHFVFIMHKSNGPQNDPQMKQTQNTSKVALADIIAIIAKCMCNGCMYRLLCTPLCSFSCL